MLEQLNITNDSWDSLKEFNGTILDAKVKKGENLFPRIDAEEKPGYFTNILDKTEQ